MGQAKQRKVEIDQLKANGPKRALIVAPLNPDYSTDNKPVGVWMRDEQIDADALVIGKLGQVDYQTGKIEVVEVALLVSKQISESQAMAALESWWKKAPRGPKFAAWVPLNDIKEMTVNNLGKGSEEEQGLKGQMLAKVLESSGFSDEFKRVLDEFMESDDDAGRAMKAIKDEILNG